MGQDKISIMASTANPGFFAECLLHVGSIISDEDISFFLQTKLRQYIGNKVSDVSAVCIVHN